jgi:integrase
MIQMLHLFDLLILILDIAGSQILRFLPNVSNMFWGRGMTGTKAPLKIVSTHRTIPTSRRTDDLSYPAPFLRRSSSDGYGIRTVQELLGHKDVKTTMIYTHVLNRGPTGVRSPVDRL